MSNPTVHLLDAAIDFADQALKTPGLSPAAKEVIGEALVGLMAAESLLEVGRRDRREGEAHDMSFDQGGQG